MNISTLPPSQFVALYAPVWGDWDEVCDTFQGSSSDERIVSLLRADLRAGKAFADPVWVTRPDEAGDDARMIVANGTHRVVASILEDAPIAFYVSDHQIHDPGMDDWVDYECVVEFLDLRPDLTDEEFVDDVVLGMLRSLPVDGRWIEAPVASLHHDNDTVSMYYSLPAELVARFPSELVSWCAAAGSPIKVRSFEPSDADDLDD